MASLKTLPILAVLLLTLLAATASARPCKTLFYFSATTTTTFYPQIPNSHPNPNPQNPRYFTLVFTTTSFSLPRPNPLNPDDQSSQTASFSHLPSKVYSSIPTSIRDRTKDIMSVVGALLFGVGCGALTAAVMYFLWALFAPGRFDLVGDESSDDDDDDDDVAAAKRKLGYVVIPTKDGDEVKKPAKEVV